MENAKPTDGKTTTQLTRAQVFLQEWRKRRKEDEEKFLKDLNDPEYRKILDSLRGKVVKNGKVVSYRE